MLIKRILDQPPIDPAAPGVPTDAKGRPLYSRPEFFRTSGCINVEGNSPQSVSQTVHLIQLAQAMQQLQQLSVYSHELFADLIDCAKSTNRRLESIKERVGLLQKLLPSVEQRMSSQVLADGLGCERQEWRASTSVDQQLLTKSTANVSLKAVYERQCLPPPELARLDKYRDDKQTCMKLYSYPLFFTEQWIALMERQMMEKKDRRHKREQQKASTNSQQQMDGSSQAGMTIKTPRNNTHELISNSNDNALDLSTNSLGPAMVPNQQLPAQQKLRNSVLGTVAAIEPQYQSPKSFRSKSPLRISLFQPADNHTAPVQPTPIQPSFDSHVGSVSSALSQHPLQISLSDSGQVDIPAPPITPPPPLAISPPQSPVDTRLPPSFRVEIDVPRVIVPPPVASVPETKAAAFIPPPPPPPPTANSLLSSGPPPAPNNISLNAAINMISMGQASIALLKKAPETAKPVTRDARSDLMAAIRGRNTVLKPTRVQHQQTDEASSKRPPGDERLADLMMKMQQRREAMEGSDDDEDQDDEDSEWN